MIQGLELAINIIFLVFLYYWMIRLFTIITKQLPIFKKNKKALKLIELFESKCKLIGAYLWMIFIMILVMSLCSMIGISLIPLIFKLNQPYFGWEYARYASYMITICLWIIISPRLINKGDIQ